MLPRQGEIGENTPFTIKCMSEPSETLERVTASGNNQFHVLEVIILDENPVSWKIY